jgi:magnesium transporter
MPGTIIIDASSENPNVSLLAYGPCDMHDHDSIEVKEIAEHFEEWPVTWINVAGLGDEAVIGELAGLFSLHKLAVEDVVHLGQRAKVEQYEGHLFIVLRLAALGQEDSLETEQLSLFLGKNYVLSFLEQKWDCFDAVRDRIRKSRGHIRELGADYLAYALIDSVIDSYFPILEIFGERVETLEDEVSENPREDTIHDIHNIKRELITLRRAIWPLREALASLLREDSPNITAGTRVYLRDCYDHVIELIDLLETYRELASGLIDVYLSSMSNKMNEVMKVLTVIATTFIPLTFVAGVYGMNFDPEASRFNMPELGWAYGYPAFWILMLIMGTILIVYFKRRGWL